jgi:hypothetical protein
MKKLLLAALLGMFSLAASANNVIGINNFMPACGAQITVQFVQHDFTTCANNGLSPVFLATTGSTYNLDDKALWAPVPLQSYQLYGVIVCITCPGFPTICLPEIFVMPGICGPMTTGPIPTPCCGTIAADIVAGGGGGVCFTLNIHP